MGARNTRPAGASTRAGALSAHLRARVEKPASCRGAVEEVIDLAGGFRADAGDLLQVGDRSPLDRLEGAEVPQQGAFAGRADADDFLKSGFAQVAPAPLPVRTDREPMRLVAQPLDEIKHRIARPELERLASGHEEGFPAGITLGALGDGDDGHIAHAERIERLARRRELAQPSVDQHKARPGRLVLAIVRRLVQPGRWRFREAANWLRRRICWRRLARRLRDEPLEPPREHLAHHAVVVAGGEVGRADVELAILIFAKALRPRDNKGADRVRPLDMAVVVNLDASRRLRKAESLCERAEQPLL